MRGGSVYDGAMNRRLFLYAGAGAAVAAIASYGYTRFATPAPATPLDTLLDLSLPDLAGQAQSLSQWRGQPMVINFWATWCKPCVKEMPELQAIHEKAGKVRFVGIGVDTADNMRKFVEKVPVSYPLLVMGAGALELLRGLGNPSGGLPFTLILNADGSIRQKILGQIDPVSLEATVLELAA
ncbi:thiol:disulfide interchange protein [Bordetella trematum]|nr:thiol:disulfide interchange protein [Bordetella trematum]